MNEMRRVEKAYFKAIGIDTEYVNDVDAEMEYLVVAGTNKKMHSLVWSDLQIISLMTSYQLTITFAEGFVLAYHDAANRVWQPYGDAQWKTRRWALGMAVVRAATDRIERGV